MTLAPAALAGLASLPWIVPPIVALARAAHSHSLKEYPAALPADAPRVSVIVPARNERRNIERCVRSVLASHYAPLEVIVVDDHSTDGTGEIAGEIARADARLRVVRAADLPKGWFGKQWACAQGAAVATGSLLLFTDADTRHAPELLPRAVNALRERNVDLLTVAGAQEMHGFWERLIQPQMFAMIAMRYGGTETVSRTRTPSNAIANGQFILLRRAAYDALGGHGLVRHSVAEDLSFAQEFVRAGRRIALLEASDFMSTRMYASLGEIIRGWRKNVYAGGRLTAFGGRAGRALFPLLLAGAPTLVLFPVVMLVLALAGVLSHTWLLWSAIVVAANLLFWFVLYAGMRGPLAYALLYPLGALMVLYIALGAIARGRRVEWKERRYLSS
ncbi:MAG TPA: glycosyltransferase family 2 protein [Gemmatimonadaceae bacterium]|nr:glycosyltransferase family 2 protein [Gemmatimonadaceae bacterium]